MRSGVNLRLLSGVLLSSPHAHDPDTRHREYRFGNFTLDLNSGFLRRGDEQVSLRPKAFDALVFLIERHGRLVTKAELIEALWPDTAVTDNSLAHCLLEIRRAVGDESQQIIRTVARRGYVFAAPIGTSVLGFEAGPAEARQEPAVLPISTSRTPASRLDGLRSGLDCVRRRGRHIPPSLRHATPGRDHV